MRCENTVDHILESRKIIQGLKKQFAMSWENIADQITKDYSITISKSQVRRFSIENTTPRDKRQLDALIKYSKSMKEKLDISVPSNKGDEYAINFLKNYLSESTVAVGVNDYDLSGRYRGFKVSQKTGKICIFDFTIETLEQITIFNYEEKNENFYFSHLSGNDLRNLKKDTNETNSFALAIQKNHTNVFEIKGICTKQKTKLICLGNGIDGSNNHFFLKPVVRPFELPIVLKGIEFCIDNLGNLSISQFYCCASFFPRKKDVNPILFDNSKNDFLADEKSLDSLFLNNEKENILFNDILEIHGNPEYRILIDELFDQLNSKTLYF